MARQTKIDKKIAEIDGQIEFLQALRKALVDTQGKPAVAKAPKKGKKIEEPIESAK